MAYFEDDKGAQGVETVELELPSAPPDFLPVDEPYVTLSDVI